MTSYNFLLGYLRLLLFLYSSNTDIMFRSIKIMSFKNIIYLVLSFLRLRHLFQHFQDALVEKITANFGVNPRGSHPRHHLIASWKRIRWAATTLLGYNKIKIIKLKLRLRSYKKRKEFVSSQIIGFSKLFVFQ